MVAAANGGLEALRGRERHRERRMSDIGMPKLSGIEEVSAAFTPRRHRRTPAPVSGP